MSDLRRKKPNFQRKLLWHLVW